VVFPLVGCLCAFSAAPSLLLQLLCFVTTGWREH